MFGNVIDRLQTLISRSFVIARFMPVLIFAGVNAAVFTAAFPDPPTRHTRNGRATPKGTPRLDWPEWPSRPIF